jgi:hypothetical protein
MTASDFEWFDSVIAHHLEGIAERPWDADSLRDFLSGLHGQVDEAKRAGVLSVHAARDARLRIGAAVRTIPGVTTVEHRDAFRPLIAHSERDED